MTKPINTQLDNRLVCDDCFGKGVFIGVIGTAVALVLLFVTFMTGYEFGQNSMRQKQSVAVPAEAR